MSRFKEFTSNIALISSKKEYSYDEIDVIQKQFYECIAQRCLIFIISKNTVPSIIGYISSLLNRVVPVMLSNALTYDKYNELILNYMPEYIWCTGAWIKECEHYKAIKVYTLENYNLYRIEYVYGLQKQLELYDELALLLPTSGSTGSPKYVRISYENIYSNTKAIVEYLQISDKDRTITTLPMNYAYGLSVINTHLYVGATIVVTHESIIKSSFWEKTKKWNVTNISGVPYTYEILKKIGFNRFHLPELKLMTQAGGHLNSDIKKYFIDMCRLQNKKFLVMYGQTEATARMSYLPYEFLNEKTESIGIPIPDGRMWLADEEGEIIETCNKEGQLVYQGKNVSLGYALNREDLSKGDERNGILYTGDYGYADNDGFFYITGRKDRQTKLFGVRMDLDGLEADIHNRFGVSCVCLSDSNKLCVYYVGEDINYVMAEYLVELLKLPAKNVMCKKIDKIPRNAAGKVLYGELEP